jgi:hypothetical protein
MTAWPEQRIDSLQDIQQLAKAIDAGWPNSNRCLFRGQSCAGWALQPSLARELVGSTMNWFQVAQLEHEMMNRFWRDGHRDLEPGVSSKKRAISLNSWPLMRHYGAPTRVLDWSLSPYVALYFAVEQRWEEDGALWWFRASTAENLMTRRFGAKYKNYERLLFETGDDQAFVGSTALAMLFTYELHLTIQRMGSQQSMFTVCLDPMADHAHVLEEFASYGDGPHHGKLIVPKELKPELLRELQLMNVTGKAMFPGLDGLGRTLTELTRLSIRFGTP